MTNLFTWLDHVCKHPAMFIRDGSLRESENMIWGYMTALQVHRIDEGLPNMRHFGVWLKQKTGWSMTCGWADAIRSHCSPPSTPLDMFFGFVNEYAPLRPLVVSSVRLGHRTSPPLHTSPDSCASRPRYRMLSTWCNIFRRRSFSFALIIVTASRTTPTWRSRIWQMPNVG